MLNFMALKRLKASFNRETRRFWNTSPMEVSGSKAMVSGDGVFLPNSRKSGPTSLTPEIEETL